MKIALATLNTKIADLDGNSQKIIEYAHHAAQLGADLLVTPELSLCGYLPYDLLDYSFFIEEMKEFLDVISQKLPPDLPVVVGWVSSNHETRSLYNSASILYQGQEVLRQSKILIPNNDVFDERRYFSPGKEFITWNYQGFNIGVLICEDFWYHTEIGVQYSYPIDPVQEIIRSGANLILGISASPFEVNKNHVRKTIIQKHAETYKVPIVYTNLVGGNDGLIFDGGSFVFNSHGELIHETEGFMEQLDLVDLESEKISHPRVSPQKQIFDALVMGTRDFVFKNNFQQVHLGLSGGIDSALVAVIATFAVGKNNVVCFAMPSRYSSESSLRDAEALAQNLQIPLKTISIDPVFQAYVDSLGPHFGERFYGTPIENIQARIRGNFLMAWSNSQGSLLLTTGNKSELATGYCTLYGDMAGGLAVIADLFKTQVYEICHWINQEFSTLIPESILVKEPSAELKENQKDQDTLPPYPVLDEILTEYLIHNKKASEITSYDQDLMNRVIGMSASAEHKRYQAPPLLKISPKSFGLGRRMPISRNYPEVLKPNKNL